MMASLWSLPPHDRAAFATSARIIACLVSESLLDALYLPITSPHPYLTGAALVLTAKSKGQPIPYKSAHIFAIVPLRHVPVFKSTSSTEIGLLDTLDMLPFVHEIHDDHNCSPEAPGKKSDELSTAILSALSHAGYVAKGATIAPSLGPLHLWKKYADAESISENVQQDIAVEFSSSVLWQQYFYENRPSVPTFESPSILWEQCIVEGHPIHPMHKMQCTVPPIPPIEPGEYDWCCPRIRIVSLPRTSTIVQGPWDDLIAPLQAEASKQADSEIDIPKDRLLAPVHELQVPVICEKFPEVQIFPSEFSIPALAQQSIRTVLVPSALRAHSLKLSLGIKLISVLRTISPNSAYYGPRFCSTVVPLLNYDRQALIVEREIGSITHVHPDPQVAAHLGVIVREAYENTCFEAHGERVIVCTALVEMGHDPTGGEVPLVQTIFGLDTEEKRLAWLDTFIDVCLRAFLPPVLFNGVTFECHQQNTLARFDATTHKLKGFLIRDLEGMRIHAPTLLASTGLTSLDSFLKPGAATCTNTLEEVYTRLYHALVHNHLQQLIRVLGLHYNGKGWAILRRHLRAQLPQEHPLKKLWLAPETTTLLGKSFIRMRLKNLAATHIHTAFPNLIHYEGDDRESSDRGL